MEAIIHRKLHDKALKSTEVRNHPECEKVQQFLVLIEDEEEQIDESRICDMFKLKETSKTEESGDDKDEDDSSDDSKSDDEEPLEIELRVSLYSCAAPEVELNRFLFAFPPLLPGEAEQEEEEEGSEDTQGPKW